MKKMYIDDTMTFIKELEDFDVLLTSDDNIVYSINILNPSCLSHGAIFYNNKIFEITRTKGLQIIDPCIFLTKQSLVCIVKYKNKLLLNEKGSRIFDQYLHDFYVKKQEYGFLKKDQTYCFKWVLVFFNLIQPNLLDNLTYILFDVYYGSETFLRSSFFDLDKMLINNQIMVSFNQ